MIISALKLLLIGMLFVFLFLLFLMLVIQLISYFFQKHALLEEKELSKEAISSKPKIPVAAIVGAVQEYRKQNG